MTPQLARRFFQLHGPQIQDLMQRKDREGYYQLMLDFLIKQAL